MLVTPKFLAVEPCFCTAKARGDEVAVRATVSGIEEKRAPREGTIAACAPGFLIIRLERTRNRVVEDQADVGFIDPHPEGVGRDNRIELAHHEAILIVVPHLT